MSHYFSIIYEVLRAELFEIPGRVIAFVFVVFLIFLPLVYDHPYLLRILTLAAIFSIYAASWDVLAGFTGQVNLGQGLFFGVSAYAGAKLNLVFGMSPWLTIPIGGIAAVVAGLLVALPALRLRGFYLSLVTLAMPIILTGIIFMIPDYTGGELGLYGIQGLSTSKISDYYVVLFIMLVSIFIMYKVTDAESKFLRTGLVLHAIREDEITARASGINTIRYKLMAFAISGFFAGIAGGLYTHYMKVVGPSTLELFFSFQPILWTIFGSWGTIYGAVVGVYILFPLTELIRVLPGGDDYRYIIFTVLLILVLLFMPQGLSIWIRDKIEVVCPRCKLTNAVFRDKCRACRAKLNLDKSEM
jgi:branched-chain amino acid transport system permease protein